MCCDVKDIEFDYLFQSETWEDAILRIPEIVSRPVLQNSNLCSSLCHKVINNHVWWRVLSSIYEEWFQSSANVNTNSQSMYCLFWSSIFFWKGNKGLWLSTCLMVVELRSQFSHSLFCNGQVHPFPSIFHKLVWGLFIGSLSSSFFYPTCPEL